jgi:hypothetical protein
MNPLLVIHAFRFRVDPLEFIGIDGVGHFSVSL